MSGRRSLELKPVPEYDKLSAFSPGETGPGSLARTAAPIRGGAGSSRDAGPPLAHASLSTTSRYQRNASARQHTGSLGRTSLVAKIQQSGRQLIDLGKLQAKWLSDTLVKKSEAQDYVNEEDQGFKALLARHVDVPASAWMRFGNPDGQFWQTGYATIAGDFARNSLLASGNEDHRAAEEGHAQEPLERKPRRSVFGLPVIQPYNPFAVLWTMAILLLDLTYTAFWVPMNVAFCTAEYGKLSSGCTSSDLAGGMLYFLNVLLGFQIGVVATHGYRKRTVVDGRLVAWLYARYGRFWLDFVASVPFVYLVVVLIGSDHFHLNKGWVNCLSLLRLLRMVRLLSITKMVYMDSLSGRFQDSAIARYLSVTVLYSIFLAYQLAVAINLLACIMVLCAYFEGYDKSWMTAVSWANVPTASPLYQWYSAVYWMVVTATTTGFGDFQPRSLAEQVVANVAMLGGMIMFGVLVASIGNALSRATVEAHKAYASRQKIMHVMDWAEHRSLPADIRKQVQNFYADKYGRKEEDSIDSAVMHELPSRLRAKVARSMCVPLMADVHILMELPEDLQQLMAENMRPLRLPAGEDLCQQGDIAGCFWLLHEGTVEAVRYKEGNVSIDASETPRLLGESVLLGDVIEACRVRPWTLRTVTPCRLWGITIGELYPLLRMYPAIGVLAAEYIKFKVVYTAKNEREGLESPDDHFCELAAIILKHLKEHTTEDEAVEILQDLFRTSAEDGTLQPYLEQLIAVCTARPGDAVSKHPGMTERTLRFKALGREAADRRQHPVAQTG
ncbi:hypothetical protein GPECTOR_14g4 [Gonium pectorale]|uniref:Cyclic nucleotide-binding domain-containing protein n=1 Tax=Gonium pectorale TaxID=33097 RepID=A0A150GMI5_GONPE|nr:hypothetical protein GPECTOR_14g4 [Gonium pectorale]|eukprot:KXZ51053.1 hypothetical protein GPECTOR_14g4 [Gonium pectorale]